MEGFQKIIGLDDEDKHTASVELSNKCREFYRRRLQDAENSRQKMSQCSSQKMSSIDVAMNTLGKEMRSLMDQDLSLMKQLLLLNEAIEDLKFQRRYSNSSMPSSSCDLSGSECSVSETDMFDSQDDIDTKSRNIQLHHNKETHISRCSLTHTNSSTYDSGFESSFA